MASWWNRMPQYSGLFDYQNVMRPDYFTFELLARVTGERLGADTNDDAVHAFLAHDDEYKTYNLIFWNFSPKPVNLKVDAHGLQESLVAHRRVLDAEAPSQDENARLRPEPDRKLTPGGQPLEVELGPYGIESWRWNPPIGRSSCSEPVKAVPELTCPTQTLERCRFLEENDTLFP